MSNLGDNEQVKQRALIAIYKMYPPNRFVRFMFRYFSQGTEKKDFIVSDLFIVFQTVLFFAGFIIAAIAPTPQYLNWAGIFYSAFLVISWGCSGIATAMNNSRIRKIRKILLMTKEEYNRAIDMIDPSLLS